MTQEGLDRIASHRVNICVREGQFSPLLNGMPLDTADVYFEHRLLKPLISTILGIFSYQLHEDSGDSNPPSPLKTPPSQRYQSWQHRGLFLLSVVQVPNLTDHNFFFRFQLPVVVEHPLWWRLEAKRSSFDTADVHFRYQWVKPYILYDF